MGDFGISKMLSSDSEAADSIVGTPYYMSPEICRFVSNFNKMWHDFLPPEIILSQDVLPLPHFSRSLTFTAPPLLPLPHFYRSPTFTAPSLLNINSNPNSNSLY